MDNLDFGHTYGDEKEGIEMLKEIPIRFLASNSCILASFSYTSQYFKKSLYLFAFYICNGLYCCPWLITHGT